MEIGFKVEFELSRIKKKKRRKGDYFVGEFKIFLLYFSINVFIILYMFRNI